MADTVTEAEAVNAFMESIGATQHDTANGYWHVEDGFIAPWQATFFYRTVVAERADELDQAFVRNAPAFADEIDIEKYWNQYYEQRRAELQRLQKGVV